MKNVEEFCTHTTIHGVSFLTIQKYRILKFFWIIIVILEFTGLSFHLYSIISSYLEYKSTQSTYERRNGFDFPDVTICNLNGISHSNLKQAAEKIPELNLFDQDECKSMNKSNSNFSGDFCDEVLLPRSEELFFCIR